MGSPLSPIVANLYMKAFEKRALDTSAQKPNLWIRYVDDVFAIWPHGDQALDEFLTTSAHNTQPSNSQWKRRKTRRLYSLMCR